VNWASPLLLAAAVAGGHYVYYAWPPGWERSWAQWVGLNVLVIVLALLLLPSARAHAAKHAKAGQLALVACWLAVIESGQAAACSLVGWGSVPKSDLCVEAAGVWPYVLAAAICGALLFARGRKT
jgi:hypothetical protein